MRKYKEKDFAPYKYCATVKLTEKTFAEDYAKCRIRKDLPKEKGMVYALIPYERIAADAITEIWGVDKSDPDKFKKAYIKAVNETLRQPTEGSLAKLERSNMSEDKKEKVKKILKIVNAYQGKLTERNLPYLEPFFPFQPPQKKKVTEEKKRVIDELLENKPLPIDVPEAANDVVEKAPSTKEESNSQDKEDKPVEEAPESAKIAEIPEIEIIDLDNKAKETESKNDAAITPQKGTKNEVPDFTLGLTIDDLFNDNTKDTVAAESDKPEAVSEDEPLPKNYIDNYFKEQTEIKTETSEPVEASPSTTPDVAPLTDDGDDDDVDIYAELLS